MRRLTQKGGSARFQPIWIISCYLITVITGCLSANKPMEIIARLKVLLLATLWACLEQNGVCQKALEYYLPWCIPNGKLATSDIGRNHGSRFIQCGNGIRPELYGIKSTSIGDLLKPGGALATQNFRKRPEAEGHGYCIGIRVYLMHIITMLTKGRAESLRKGDTTPCPSPGSASP